MKHSTGATILHIIFFVKFHKIIKSQKYLELIKNTVYYSKFYNMYQIYFTNKKYRNYFEVK